MAYINYEQLAKMEFPVGANIVVYSPRSREAIFMHKQDNGFFRLSMVRKKRAAKIERRRSDSVCLCNSDGTVTQTELPEIFEDRE